jgi:hypothetical protein
VIVPLVKFGHTGAGRRPGLGANCVGGNLVAVAIERPGKGSQGCDVITKHQFARLADSVQETEGR